MDQSEAKTEYRLLMKHLSSCLDRGITFFRVRTRKTPRGFVLQKFRVRSVDGRAAFYAERMYRKLACTYSFHSCEQCILAALNVLLNDAAARGYAILIIVSEILSLAAPTLFLQIALA